MNKKTFLGLVGLMLPITSFADYRVECDALIFNNFYYSEDHVLELAIKLDQVK